MQQLKQRFRFFRRFLLRLRSIDYAPLLLIWATAMFYVFFCLYTGRDIFGASGYSTYTLQALAWRDGKISLGQDYPWLELAVYQGDWFVSFPPVPSIPLFFLTFVFGSQTPDHLLVKLYVLIGCLSVYVSLRRSHYDKLSAVGFSLLCSFASCLLALTTDGAVWYQAQTLAFCLACLSIALMAAKRTTPALFLYALSVGCRPFNVLFGAVLFAMYIDRSIRRQLSLQQALLRLIPGVLLGLTVAAAYGWYNYIRFGNIFEFGHNYLPEFSTQGGKQFALSHIPKNLKTFLLALPFENGKLRVFGFSFLLACPVFLLQFFWILRDILFKRFSWIKLVICLCMLLHFMLLLLHRTFGGYQFGARYTCDILPYTAAYLIAEPGRSMHLLEAMVLFSALAFSIYGAATLLL